MRKATFGCTVAHVIAAVRHARLTAGHCYDSIYDSIGRKVATPFAVASLSVASCTTVWAHDTGTPHIEFDQFTATFTALLATGLPAALIGGVLYYHLQRRAILRRSDSNNDKGQ